MLVTKPDATMPVMFAILTTVLFFGCWRSDWSWTWSGWSVGGIVIWVLLAIGTWAWIHTLLNDRGGSDP